jgi:hypothetical protein
LVLAFGAWAAQYHGYKHHYPRQYQQRWRHALSQDLVIGGLLLAAFALLRAHLFGSRPDVRPIDVEHQQAEHRRVRSIRPVRLRRDQLLGAPWLYKGYVGAWQWGKAATENGKPPLYFVVGVITYVFCVQGNFAGPVAAFLNNMNSVAQWVVFFTAAVEGVHTMLTRAPGAHVEFREYAFAGMSKVVVLPKHSDFLAQSPCRYPRSLRSPPFS